MRNILDIWSFSRSENGYSKYRQEDEIKAIFAEKDIHMLCCSLIIDSEASCNYIFNPLFLLKTVSMKIA